MGLRHCLDCRTLITKGSRCKGCTTTRARANPRIYDLANYRARRGGLARAWQSTSAPCWLAVHGLCLLQGAPISYGEHGTPSSLHADHIRAGDPTSPLAPAHALCNESRGARPAPPAS